MAPLRFVFGLHFHQPVGNFDHVFRQHLDDVYAPLIDRLAGADFLPIVLHISGPFGDLAGRPAAPSAGEPGAAPVSTPRPASGGPR